MTRVFAKFTIFSDTEGYKMLTKITSVSDGGKSQHFVV